MVDALAKPGVKAPALGTVELKPFCSSNGMESPSDDKQVGNNA
jgi:hypothetical protein